MNKTTVTIQIGNSDDHLTQAHWSRFVGVMDSMLSLAGEIHFAGGSRNDAPWQNYCWVISVPTDAVDKLKLNVSSYRWLFEQKSVAFTEGETLFV